MPDLRPAARLLSPRPAVPHLPARTGAVGEGPGPGQVILVACGAIDEQPPGDVLMSTSDPIADMLTRIRNSLMAGHQLVSMPSSKVKLALAGILKAEGLIESFEQVQPEGRPNQALRLQLKYVGERAGARARAA